MKRSVINVVTILFLAGAMSLSLVTSPTAEEPNEPKQMNCFERMEIMKKQMNQMMDNHKMVMSDMKSLFGELQKSGQLTQEQKEKMKKIELMMNQMEEKMKEMSSMETEERK